MKADLGNIIPILRGWILCIDECASDCACCADLSGMKINEKLKTAVALYLFAYNSRRYQLVAAMHVYTWRNRITIDPELLTKAKKEGKVLLRIAEYDADWEAVYWRGLCYSQAFIDLEKPVLVKIDPPKDKKKREKLRVLLEGKRVTVKGKTYHVGGLLKKLGGKKVAPWVYLVPKKSIPSLSLGKGIKFTIVRLS